MTNQIFSSLVTICNFFVALPEPINASSRDYGFDFDENELAEELLARLPDSPEAQPIPDMNADEFESRTLWFLS
jgi:hypothetical protein